MHYLSAVVLTKADALCDFQMLMTSRCNDKGLAEKRRGNEAPVLARIFHELTSRDREDGGGSGLRARRIIVQAGTEASPTSRSQ
jgi:hypothetical protein